VQQETTVLLLTVVASILLGFDNYQTGATDFDLLPNTVRDCESTLIMCEIFCCEAFFVVAAAACSQLFCRLLGKYLLLSDLNNACIIRRAFFDYKTIPVDDSCITVCVLHGTLFTQFVSMAIS